MCVSACLCVCVCISVYARLLMCVHVCLSMCVRACVHVYASVSACACVPLCECAHLCVCMHASVCACLCVCLCMCLCMPLCVPKSSSAPPLAGFGEPPEGAAGSSLSRAVAHLSPALPWAFLSCDSPSGTPAPRAPQQVVCPGLSPPHPLPGLVPHLEELPGPGRRGLAPSPCLLSFPRVPIALL